MKILHIIAQKPNSTGSGIYMCGMINGFEKLGYEQAVVAGIDISDDINCFSTDINFYPVIYNSGELDFDVLGMSDSMPYSSTRYRDLDEDMINKFKITFTNKIEIAIKDFSPDLIICNHLYLLTSITREIVENIKLVGLCHGTCLRQVRSINLKKDYILDKVSKLDMILALHQKQKEDIIDIFSVDEDKVKVIGSGYNDKIFYNKNYKKNNNVINITYAGKICKTKGLKSLIKAISNLSYPKELIKLSIAGNGSDEEQYKEIREAVKLSHFKIEFVGKLDQIELAELFNKSHIFVLPSFYEGLPVVVLEALACGTEVITTDIEGVKEWMGNQINDSGKIDYLNLPKMKGQGIPFEDELDNFEKILCRSLSNRIDNILNKKDIYSKIDIKDKTWDGLSLRITKFIDRM